MHILAQCPRCNQILQLAVGAADRRITCPECSTLFKVPDLGHLDKALKVIEGANGTIFVDQDGKAYG